MRPTYAAAIAVLSLSVASFVPLDAQTAGPPFRPAVRAGSVIYLSGSLPMGADNTIVGKDAAAQTRQTLNNLKRVLEQNGSRLDKVASVTVYLKRAADFAAMNEVFRTYWPAAPPARTTIVANLVVPDALVEISMIALVDEAERAVVQPPGWMQPPSPYSYAIRSGDTLFLSGLVPRSGRDNAPVKGDITEQTTAVLANAGEILKSAGMDASDVVSARVYLTDTAMFEAMNAAYRRFFPKDPPARATVRTALTSPDYLVEIALMAVSAKDRKVITTPNADGTAGHPSANLSSAVRAGNRLFLSGMLGHTAANAGDVGGQTREALARIGRTLQAAGFGWGDVVDSTVYLTDAASAPAMNDSYRQLLTRGYPARATIEAGLVSPGAVVEIAMTAARQ
jgi:2-iminobutanoate/2-iminopropanoate deaminase